MTGNPENINKKIMLLGADSGTAHIFMPLLILRSIRVEVKQMPGEK